MKFKTWKALENLAAHYPFNIYSCLQYEKSWTVGQRHIIQTKKCEKLLVVSLKNRSAPKNKKVRSWKKHWMQIKRTIHSWACCAPGFLDPCNCICIEGACVCNGSCGNKLDSNCCGDCGLFSSASRMVRWGACPTEKKAISVLFFKSIFSLNFVCKVFLRKILKYFMTYCIHLAGKGLRRSMSNMFTMVRSRKT